MEGDLRMEERMEEVPLRVGSSISFFGSFEVMVTTAAQ